MARQIGDLPHALDKGEALARHLAGKRVAVFLDYDGTLTPIRDRPNEAIISESMRETVQRLAERVPVCVISGRDRKVVQELMGHSTPVLTARYMRPTLADYTAAVNALPGVQAPAGRSGRKRRGAG